jgi:hypothetical protein
LDKKTKKKGARRKGRRPSCFVYPGNNSKRSLKNAQAKEEGKKKAKRRGMGVALTGTEFKEKWLQGMYHHSKGSSTIAKATKDFMAGGRVAYIFAQGEHFSIVWTRFLCCLIDDLYDYRSVPQETRKGWDLPGQG